jgi:hypothetical protein
MLSPRKIAQDLNLSDRNIEELLALRILFDDPKDIVDLDQDIKDLEFFPERLEASYRHEWVTFISRAIAKMCKSSSEASENKLTDAIQQQMKNVQSNDDQRYEQLMQFVALAQGIGQNGNVVSLPHPMRKKLEQFLML